jgi:hypothetical protein
VKKLASVFALALVLVLAMGAAAFAAPEGMTLISNVLDEEFDVSAVIVPIERLKEGSTKVPDVVYGEEAGKVSLQLTYTVDGDGKIIDAEVLEHLNNQSVGEGGNPNIGYHEIQVTRPVETANYVRFTGKGLRLDGSDWVYEGKIWGVTHTTQYFPVAEKVDDVWMKLEGDTGDFIVEWYKNSGDDDNR